MNKRLVAGASLAAVLLLGAVFAFNFAGSDSPSSKRETSSTPFPSGSAEPTASASDSGSMSPAAPGEIPFPTPSLPAGSEGADPVMAINRIIFEITQEATKPGDDKMTPEEVSALIQSRIKELRERQ